MIAKMQSIDGYEYFIHKNITLANNYKIGGLNILECKGLPPKLADIYQDSNGEFYLKPYVECHVENQPTIEERKINNFNRIWFPCNKCKSQIHIYTFILPLREPLKFDTGLNTSSNQKSHDKILYCRWSQDEKETLKKLILQFGYGRWNKLQQIRFQAKPKTELKSFSNALIRSIADQLPIQELGQELNNLIDENQDDAYIEPNQKDWELQNLKQKLVSIGKRIIMLSKIRQFIKKFKEDQFKKLGTNDKSQLNWDYLLGFIPSSSFYSQRPSIWWTRKHDSDLIRGVYKYGYTNHTKIRQAEDLCFKDLDYCINITMLENNYQEFPFHETLNKRVKKLVSIINKFDGNYDFDNLAQSDDEEQKLWSLQDKQSLFQLLCDFGVPIGIDGRQNWQDLKDKLMNKIGKFDRNLNQLEKMVQTIRTRCEQILMRNKDKKFLDSESSDLDSKQYDKDDQEVPIIQDQDEFIITLADAQKFSKQTNLLHFIRKTILPQAQQLFQTHQQAIQKQLEIDVPGYDIIQHDIFVLQHLNQYGYSGLNNIKLNNIDQFITQDEFISRIEKLCSFFKKIRDQSNTKRKSEYTIKDEIVKKPKTNYNLSELILPSQINASLKLIQLGKIIPTIYYHSEHNLFPVGYKSIRTYSSMFTKGKRCQYSCEIIEGADGRPIFKVTSEEDIDNPIIKNSCTGCWVYICNRVNDLQDHKKQKVTISGTDRFGLLEPNVQKYLEELPGAELCQKYKFKYRQMEM